MIQAELFETPEYAAGTSAGSAGAASPETAAPPMHASPPPPAMLYELSVNAYTAALHAGMSELPMENEIARFIEKVLKAGREAGGAKLITGSGKSAAERAAAEAAAVDRGDPDVLAVLRAAGRVRHEIHRITGFLRFSLAADGVYTARCSPDHFILPALAEHFSLRFGETPWAVIDEKRKLCLSGEAGGRVRLVRTEEAGCEAPAAAEKDGAGYWEELWRLYHRSINNEGRKNLALQRQFMPERYRKYLTELN